MLQPYQEQIAELIEEVDNKLKEFNSSKGVIDTTEDPLITQVMLTVAQDFVIAMDQDIAKLKEKFHKIS